MYSSKSYAPGLHLVGPRNNKRGSNNRRTTPGRSNASGCGMRSRRNNCNSCSRIQGTRHNKECVTRMRQFWLNQSNGWRFTLIRPLANQYMLRVLRMRMAYSQSNTHLSRLAACMLIRRLNVRYIVTSGMNCTFLVSKWIVQQCVITYWKPAFTANCTCTIICAEIAPKSPQKSGRGIRTTGNK